MEILDISIFFITFLFVIITIVIGVKIALTYLKFHDKIFLYIGIAWFGISFPLIPDALEPIFLLTTPTISDIGLMLLYSIFNVVLLPVFVVIWLHALTKLLKTNNKSKKIILIVALIFSIIFEVLFGFYFLTDPSAIGTVTSPYHIIWSAFIDVLLLSSLSIVLITGFIFAGKSFKEEQKEIRLKGKILIIAFSLFVLGALIDALFTTDISNIIARMILVISSISFYIGFILPKWAKKILL